MEVSLLTHAFSCLDTELESGNRTADAGESPAEASTSGSGAAPGFSGLAALSERKLGILRSDLRFYRLQPVNDLGLREDGLRGGEEESPHIAVAVNNSALTLQSIERLLVERAALEGELAACKQQLLDRRREDELERRKSVGETKAQYWKRRAEDLQLEVHALRSQSSAAESLRLKSEAMIESLAKEYAQDYFKNASPDGDKLPPNDSQAPLEKRLSGTSALERRTSLRGVDGLCTDEVLNKLEKVIDQLSSGNMLLDKVTRPQALARPMKAG